MLSYRVHLTVHQTENFLKGQQMLEFLVDYELFGIHLIKSFLIKILAILILYLYFNRL